MAVGVTAVRSVALGVRDLAKSREFYTTVWGLEVAAEAAGSVYLRGTGPYHHSLSLHARDASQVICIDLLAGDRGALDALSRSVAAAGGRIEGQIAPLSEPGSGVGFAFRDPEGRRVRVIADDARHAPVANPGDRPVKLSHVVLNADDRAAMADFYTRALGFRIIDRTGAMSFLNCNSDHHSLAFVQHPSRSVHHMAFEMPSIDGVMRGAGRLRDHGHPMEWGVGRHGPGNNVFAYFVGPDEEAIEYTAEVEQVDESYRPGGPEDWTWPPGRRDHWGIAIGPSERMRASHLALKFVGSGPAAS